MSLLPIKHILANLIFFNPTKWCQQTHFRSKNTWAAMGFMRYGGKAYFMQTGSKESRVP